MARIAAFIVDALITNIGWFMPLKTIRSILSLAKGTINDL